MFATVFNYTAFHKRHDDNYAGIAIPAFFIPSFLPSSIQTISVQPILRYLPCFQLSHSLSFLLSSIPPFPMIFPLPI